MINDGQWWWKMVNNDQWWLIMTISIGENASHGLWWLLANYDHGAINFAPLWQPLKCIDYSSRVSGGHIGRKDTLIAGRLGRQVLVYGGYNSVVTWHLRVTGGTRRWRRFFYDGEGFIGRIYHPPRRSQDSRHFPVEMKRKKIICLPFLCKCLINGKPCLCGAGFASLSISVISRQGYRVVVSLTPTHAAPPAGSNHPKTMVSLWRVLQYARRVSSSIIGIPTSPRELHHRILDTLHMLTPAPVEFKKLLTFRHEFWHELLVHIFIAMMAP